MAHLKIEDNVLILRQADFFEGISLYDSRKVRIFAARIIKLKKIMEARLGDNVLISPDVTHKSDWTRGVVIDVEANPFVGTVISAKTADGEIYFEKEYLFKPAI